MNKFVALASVFALVGIINVVGCGDPNTDGMCPANCPSNDAGTDTAPVCTETVKGLSCAQLGVGNLATTCNGTKSFVCCQQASGTLEFQDGTSCSSAPADTGAPTCNVTAGQACSNLGLATCNNTFVCCANGSGAVQWTSGSSCSATPPVDSGTTPPVDSGSPASDPLPSGGSSGAATVTISGTVPMVDGKAADRIYVQGGQTTHDDMRPDPAAQWKPGSAWSAFGTNNDGHCDVKNGTTFSCTVSKEAGYDLRFQIYVQRGVSTYYLCNTTPVTFDPGKSTYTVTYNGGSTPIAYTFNGADRSWVNCDVGS